MADHSGIFPSFLLSGFECSTFIWKDYGRRNLMAETQHLSHAHEDYNILRGLGFAAAREAIPWPFVAQGTSYDFSCIDPIIKALNETHILPIWDLCHYGYPNHLDPFSADFAESFARYCHAAAKYVVSRLPGPYCFTPINEITLFSFCGGEWGWIAPFQTSRAHRHRLLFSLCRAAIAGVRAIREVDPNARMVHMDPLVQVVAPRDRPDQADRAYYETYVDTFVAWDIICGKQHPEFGGTPEILDIVGVSYYPFGQMEYREDGPHHALPPMDDRIKPLRTMLHLVWERYQRPILIGETSGVGIERGSWLNYVMEESLAAIDVGIDLHGICVFPAVDMPHWHTGEGLHIGICDLLEEGGILKRCPYEPYVQELRRWQKQFAGGASNPLSHVIKLEDIIEAAKRRQQDKDG